MRKILYLFKIIVGLASDLSQVVGYIFTFLSALFCSRVTLATRVLAAESQLAACKVAAFQGLGSMASSGTSDAARHAQAMAHHSLPCLLAPEVERSDGPASSVEGEAGSDSSTQPRESLQSRYHDETEGR